jgi:hypothetical protein
MRGLLAGLAAGVAAPSAAPLAGAQTALPDWSGVWNPHERNIFDPTAFQAPGNAGKGAQEIREFPPYRPEWEARYLRVLQASKAGKPTDPTANCTPGGMPRIMGAPYPFELVVERNRVVVLHEAFRARRIWTDGRGHPADLDATAHL